MKNPFSLIREDLPKSEEDLSLAELQGELAKYLIRPYKQLPPMRFLFTFNGTPCCPVCELVADTGKAKSGKTLFMSLLMACAMSDQQLALQRTGEEPLTVLWYDTEQSEQSTQDILLNRIMPMAGIQMQMKEAPDIQSEDGTEVQASEVEYLNADGQRVDFDDHFYVLNVRGIGWELRKQLLHAAIVTYKPDLVILDGTKDLLLDINDATQATITTEELMRWAQLNKCCIVNVLHQNKSESDRNMRGSIGIELTNKAFEVFQCEQLQDTGTFKVEHALSRKQRAPKSMYYQLDDTGIPQECGKPMTQPRDENGRFMSPKSAAAIIMAPEVKWESFNQKYIVESGDDEKKQYDWDLKQLFEDAFEGRSQRPYNQVMGAAIRLSHIVDKSYYYALFEEAERRQVISSVKHPETGETFVEYKGNLLPF